MPADDKENVQEIVRLRQELKQWEKQFVSAHDGRKPGRDDIKKDTTIAAKYKQYDRLRRPSELPQSLGTLAQTSKQPEDHVLRERSTNAMAATPKRTPSKRKFLTSHTTTLSPVQEAEPTPAFIRCALGPTPQKDGRVLGIFDMLSTGTPSKHTSRPLESATATTAVLGTPSKPAPSAEPALSRTPQSSGKRFFLDAFAGTPLKRKRDEDDDEEDVPNTSRRKYATPSFLRRSFPLGTIEEDSAEPAAYAPAFKKRGLVRSLSSIIQGLRKQEEARMDEEWDILNEIEGEDAQRPDEKPAKTPGVAAAAAAAEADSQAAEMPLGPDRAPDSDEEAAAEDGALGFVRKPWKKKGLKRQTRRVIMRPVTHQPRKAEDALAGGQDDDDDQSDEDEAEQLRAAGEDDRAAEHGGNADHPSDESVPAGKKALKSDKSSSASQKNVEKGGGVAKKARKISAQAHANFRKLKIKNKNSKAKGRGRFGKR